MLRQTDEKIKKGTCESRADISGCSGFAYPPFAGRNNDGFCIHDLGLLQKMLHRSCLRVLMSF